MKFVITLLVVLAFATPPTTAGVNEAIKFARGASSKTIEGAVVRGDRDFYTVGAKAGQTMEVVISATEKNAVFAIFQPGYKIKKSADMIDIQGRSLKKAAEEDEARNWKGKLPVNGNYLISVGGTRGNASYKLRISVK
jgi:hypothetical protein